MRGRALARPHMACHAAESYWLGHEFRDRNYLALSSPFLVSPDGRRTRRAIELRSYRHCYGVGRHPRRESLQRVVETVYRNRAAR